MKKQNEILKANLIKIKTKKDKVIYNISSFSLK